MVDVITCAIFGDCRLRGVGVVREVSLPSPIDFSRRLYNTGHTTLPKVCVWQNKPELMLCTNFSVANFNGCINK